MRDTDPRLNEFFTCLRQAMDVLEQIMLRPHRTMPMDTEREDAEESPIQAPLPAPVESPKLSYTIKEVRKLVSISNTTIYRAIGNHELRAVKFGHKTLILAKDLHDWLASLPAIR
jgi:excisionase family DNA binding protein